MIGARVEPPIAESAMLAAESLAIPSAVIVDDSPSASSRTTIAPRRRGITGSLTDKCSSRNISVAWRPLVMGNRQPITITPNATSDCALSFCGDGACHQNTSPTQVPLKPVNPTSLSSNGSERFLNAPFSQHCKNGTDSQREHLPQRRRHQNETASDNRTYRLCLFTCANYVGVGYARSNTLYAGRNR